MERVLILHLGMINLREIYLLGNIRTVKRMVMELIFIKMVINMREIIKIINYMGLVYIIIMALSIEVNIKMVKDMVKVF